MAAAAARGNFPGELGLSWTGRYYRRETFFSPEFVGKLAEFFRMPELCYPAAARVEDRESTRRLACDRLCLGTMIFARCNGKFKMVIRHIDAKCGDDEGEIFTDDVQVPARLDSVGQQYTARRLAKTARTIPSAGATGQFCDHCRLPQALQIYGDVEVELPQAGTCSAISDSPLSRIFPPRILRVSTSMRLSIIGLPAGISAVLCSTAHDIAVSGNA